MGLRRLLDVLAGPRLRRHPRPQRPGAVTVLHQRLPRTSERHPTHAGVRPGLHELSRRLRTSTSISSHAFAGTASSRVTAGGGSSTELLPTRSSFPVTCPGPLGGTLFNADRRDIQEGRESRTADGLRSPAAISRGFQRKACHAYVSNTAPWAPRTMAAGCWQACWCWRRGVTPRRAFAAHSHGAAPLGPKTKTRRTVVAKLN